MRRPALVLAYLVSAGCSQAYMRESGLSDDSRESLTIHSPYDPATTQQRVQRAAVDSGFTVTQTQPGLVVVGPYKLRQDKGVTVTLRANIVGDSSGSRIVVTGTETDELGRALGRSLAGRQGEATSENQPIREATRGRNAWKWGELARFAAAIEEAASH